MRKPQNRRYEPMTGSLNSLKWNSLKSKKEYKATNRIQVLKCPLYGITFNFIDSRYLDIFAAVGSNKVSVYQCREGGGITLLQTYVDTDEEENFYTASWACNVDGSSCVVVGGLNAKVHVIDVGRERIGASFQGHGDAINELKTQPSNPSLVISASKDESLRLWNVQNGTCVLIFAGARGHRNEVLSVDFHPTDMFRLASCGMDGTVKIWSMKEFWKYVERSFTWTDIPSSFPTKYVQHPIFSVTVHLNYADCNRWLGEFILSKSVQNEILLWEPKVNERNPKGEFEILQKYPVPHCNLWYMKFSCDFNCNEMAIGNKHGRIYVWNLKSSPPMLVAKLSHNLLKCAVRQTAMSYDGSTILGCCDDGTIWRWDEVKKPSA